MTGAGAPDVAVFAYRAATADGAQETGVLEAATREAAVEVLVGRGLFPIEVRLETRLEERRARISAGDLALGLRMLATLLESGLSMPRALAAMETLAPGAWAAALVSIRESVRRGESLAAAMRAAPLRIPQIVIGIIQAGEAGSGVVQAVRRAAELAESTAAIRTAIRNALAYPAVLAVAGAASIGLLVGVVIPRFAAILADLGQALPPTTRFVLTIAAMVRAGAVPALIGAGLLFLGWRVWTSSDAGRRQWHAALLSLPGVGAVRRSAATARMCAAAAALLESGVPIAPALAHAAATAGDAELSGRLLEARAAVIGGEGLARALDATGAMTPTAVRLVRTGEETGRLAAMLEHAARLEAENAERAVRSAVRLLEPTLILVFAGLVALVAAALLQAVYGVRPTS